MDAAERLSVDATIGSARHRVRVRTPTGTTYDSTAPPLLEGRQPAPDLGWLERGLQRRPTAA